MLAEVTDVRDRLSLLVRWTCVPQNDGDVPGAWGLWFDLWAQAFRHPEVKADRVELDGRWRDMIVDVVRAGQADGTIAAREIRARRHRRPHVRHHVRGAARRLSIQVALEDPESARTRRTTSRWVSPSANSACPKRRRRRR